jgi:anhydro-N-acetylmuramic acid kinase
MIVAGIMSGTSLDGIDVAVVDIRAGRVRPLDFRTVPYSRSVREQILAVSNRECPTGAISRLNFLLPRLYAQAAGPLLKKHPVALIGCHGQTIYHGPGDTPPNTLQIGDGSVLAELTGIPVVSDFRPRDMAAGGQGAPLVPFVDYQLFRHRTFGRVALNIGGIANLTAIPPKATANELLAFDTGPGNMVIDGLVRRVTHGRRACDRSGLIASRGHVQQDLLDELLKEPYYRLRPPKSAGREQYGEEFVSKLLATGRSAQNLIATATALTASTIAAAIQRLVEPRMRVDDLIVSGGGARNLHMMGLLESLLPRIRVQTSADYGVDPDAKEAIAFAVLAHETLHRRASNVPSATGAGRAVVLGKVSF